MGHDILAEDDIEAMEVWRKGEALMGYMDLVEVDGATIDCSVYLCTEQAVDHGMFDELYCEAHVLDYAEERDAELRYEIAAGR